MTPSNLIFAAAWLGVGLSRLTLAGAPTTMAISSIALTLSILLLMFSAVAQAEEQPGRFAEVSGATLAVGALGSFAVGISTLMVGFCLVA